MTGHGEDLANLTANVAKDVAVKTSESVSKAAGNIAKMLLEMLLMKAKNRSEKVKFGKTNLEEILKSGQDVKMVKMDTQDIKFFKDEAKILGIQFAVAGKRGKEPKNVMFKASDIERVNEALQNMVEKKLEVAESASIGNEIGPEIKNVNTASNDDRPSVKNRLTEIKKSRQVFGSKTETKTRQKASTVVK